ncbi:MAG: hypothetical protein ACI4JM_08240 [Oscillospiraceae bacterium]
MQGFTSFVLLKNVSSMDYFCRGDHWSPIMVYWKFHQAALSCPHTPVSLIRATKGSAFGNRQLFEKSWAKTFNFAFCLVITFFNYPTDWIKQNT